MFSSSESISGGIGKAEAFNIALDRLVQEKIDEFQAEAAKYESGEHDEPTESVEMPWVYEGITALGEMKEEILTRTPVSERFDDVAFKVEKLQYFLKLVTHTFTTALERGVSGFKKEFVAGVGEGVQGFVYGRLQELIDMLGEKGAVDDFDKYRPCHTGDQVLSLLGNYAGTRELIKQKSPELKREVCMPEGVEEAEMHDPVIFIAGYGATLKPYKMIFTSHFNRPVIAYQMPYDLLDEDPEHVRKSFESICEVIASDPQITGLKNVKIIGNSIGTMVAQKVSRMLLTEDPERTVDLAEIQTGVGYVDALKNTQGKFANEFRDSLAERGMSLDDYRDATSEFNPFDNAAELGRLAKEGRLNLSIFGGYNDYLITGAEHELMGPLFEALDTYGEGAYDAFITEEGGHNASVLFFLWLSTHKATPWAEVLKSYEEGETVGATELNARHQIRKNERRQNNLSAAVTASNARVSVEENSFRLIPQFLRVRTL